MTPWRRGTFSSHGREHGHGEDGGSIPLGGAHARTRSVSQSHESGARELCDAVQAAGQRGDRSSSDPVLVRRAADPLEGACQPAR